MFLLVLIYRVQWNDAGARSQQKYWVEKFIFFFVLKC